MTQQNKSSTTLFETDQYEVTLGYLEYGDNESDKLSFPMRIRERHLTPGQTDAILQAIGPELQITVRSSRDSIIIRLPFTEWYTSRAYTGTLTGSNNGILSIGRFEDYIETVSTPYKDEQGQPNLFVSGLLWVYDEHESDEE